MQHPHAMSAASWYLATVELPWGIRMQRRDFIALVGSVAAGWPLAASAQEKPKVWRIAVLSPGMSGQSPPLQVFRQGLREVGYVEGQNLAILWKFGGDSVDELTILADEIVASKVDAIFAINTSAALAAKNATSTIPIVVTRVSDPIRTGLVASLPHPGGNVTGLTTVSEELEGKRLELLREALPRLVRVAVLWNAANPGHAMNVKELETAAQRLGLQVFAIGIKRADELPTAIERANNAQAGALFVIDDLLISSYQAQILELTTQKARLPVISQFRDFTVAGGLMAYGPNNDEMFRRVALFIDKIFKGTNPADLPVQAPTKFDLVINLKTAKSLGLSMPPSLLARADEVIE
jgi:putative ABC transport system substrate-binding protein